MSPSPPCLQSEDASASSLVDRLAEAIKLAGQPPAAAAADVAPGQTEPKQPQQEKQQQQQQQQQQQGQEAQRDASTSSSSSSQPAAGEAGQAAAAGAAGDVAAGGRKQLPAFLRMVEGQQAWQPPATLAEQVSLVRTLAPPPIVVQGVAAADEDLSALACYAGAARAATLYVSTGGVVVMVLLVIAVVQWRVA